MKLSPRELAMLLVGLSVLPAHFLPDGGLPAALVGVALASKFRDRERFPKLVLAAAVLVVVGVYLVASGTFEGTAHAALVWSTSILYAFALFSRVNVPNEPSPSE